MPIQQVQKVKIPFALFSWTAGTRLYCCRRQFDFSHLTSTEGDSAGCSKQLALSASAKYGILTASKACHG